MGIDPRSQVRHLIQGIKITEFGAVKARIMSTASIRTDYDICVSLYKTFIDQSKKVSPPELNISVVDSSNHKGGGKKKRKGGSVGALEYVYYSKKEYKAHSSDRIAALYKKRQAMVHNPAEKKVSSKRGGATENLVKQVSALVYVMTSALDPTGISPPTTNSKNPSLTRQRILRELSVSSVARTTRINSVLTDDGEK